MVAYESPMTSLNKNVHVHAARGKNSPKGMLIRDSGYRLSVNIQSKFSTGIVPSYILAHKNVLAGFNKLH